MLDVFIEDRTKLDRSTIDTNRTDNLVLTALEPLSILDTHTFRWGGHTYSVKAVDGVLQDESTGVRLIFQ